MLKFGDGSISKEDWKGMKQVLRPHYKILEFGAGISTKLLAEYGCTVTSFETSRKWKRIVEAECKDVNIILWNNRDWPAWIEKSHFDLAFVDGVEPRDWQFELASRVADRILVHDGARKQEIELCKKYLSNWKEKPISGRCRYFERPHHQYGALVSCTGNYLPYLRALLNSFDEHKMSLDMHLLLLDCKFEQEKEYSFNVYCHEYALDDFRSKIKNQTDGNIAKKSRYLYIKKLPDYNVLLLLDADLMLVRNIQKFFDMVNGTDVILGVSERFKWPLDKFHLEGKQLPDIRMKWMVCNVPLFFCPERNKRFVKEAERCALHVTNDDGSFPSDIYTMNIALYTSGSVDKVISLPNYAWTGVHTSYINPWTRIYKKDGKWESFCGEPVYMLHGRWDQDRCEAWYFSELEKRFNELSLPDNVKNKHRNLALATVNQIKEEFRRLS